jgi:hypothetical protein
MTRSRGYSSKDLHVFKEGGSSRLSWFPSDFGKALWLRSWQMSGAHGGVSGRPDLRRRRDIFGLMEADEALQHSSLTIRKGRLCMKVRRPGGAFRIITVPPQPELVARLASWFLSHPNSMRFRRFECLRTRIFAGEDTGLVEGPERVALKLLRSVYDSTDGCALAEDGRSFLIEGSSGLVYDVNSGIRGTGAHGSRFKIRCIGPVAEKGRPGLPHQRRHEDICIRESQGPKLPLGDLMVQAILTCSQDLQAASRIPSINAAIANWQGRMDQIDREQRRRADPLGEQFRVLERLAERVRGDWMHLRLRRVTASFPALWSTIIRAPVGSVMRFTSLENALMEPGRPNISFEDVSTRFRTQSNMERQVVRRMLMGAGWTRQTQEERRTGDRQIWHRMSRPDNRDLGAAINNFCGLLEIIVRVNGRRMPMAPEHLQLSFEADSGVYHTALLPASRGLIA